MISNEKKCDYIALQRKLSELLREITSKKWWFLLFELSSFL